MNRRFFLIAVLLLGWGHHSSASHEANQALLALEQEARARVRALDESAPARLERATYAREATALRTKVQEIIVSDDWERMSVEMLNAISASFNLSCAAEWGDFQSAENGLNEWEHFLRRNVGDRTEVANIMLCYGERLVSKWLAAEPVEGARIMDEVSAKYGRFADAMRRKQWNFSKATFEAAINSNSRFPELELKKRFDRFLNEGEIAPGEKISLVSAISRARYEHGQAREANDLLAGFAQKNPEALRNIGYIHVWFYVSLFGLGDRPQAQSLLKLISLNDSAVIPKSDPRFAIFDAYYSTLNLTDSQLRLSAKQTMNRRKTATP